MHPLDHPVWNALTTSQKHLAEGDALARRYPPAMVPFAAMTDTSPESFAALRALMSPSEVAVFFTTEPVTPPGEFKLLMARTGEQMVGTPAAVPTDDIITLGAADVAAMMELTKLTNPGPFALRTREMGIFLGIKQEGRLVAMAGERVRPAEYTEITAVCVHPDCRGRGYAQMLIGAVARLILARGEIPFLHVFSDNHSALALYLRQGMEIRRRMHVTVLTRAD